MRVASGEDPRDWPPCAVCGRGAVYEHEGARYCARNACQLVAAGQWTLDYARSDYKARGIKVPS